MGNTQSKFIKEQRLLLAPRHLTMYVIVSPTCVERLHLMGCGLKRMLMIRLSLCVGSHVEPKWNSNASHNIMMSIACRVTGGIVAAVRNKAAKEAEELCALGQCVAALIPLHKAIVLGDLPSRALMAWLHINGREGVTVDRKRGFELAKEGASLGCQHCLGVMAICYKGHSGTKGGMEGVGFGIQRDTARSLELARQSSENGSMYGQCALGDLLADGEGGVAQDCDQALVLYKLAAAQNFDGAQCNLGCLYSMGIGVYQSYAEGQRWYQLAATQGHPRGLFEVASGHEHGWGVRADKVKAIRLYRQAQAAGHPVAAYALRRLKA